MVDTPTNETSVDYTELLEAIKEQNEQLLANSNAMLESNAAYMEQYEEIQLEQLHLILQGVQWTFAIIVIWFVYYVFSRALSVVDRA